MFILQQPMTASSREAGISLRGGVSSKR